MNPIDPEKMSLEEQAEWLSQQEEWAEEGEDIIMGSPMLVIWDLDGTLIDSERIVQKVVRNVVERRGCEYTDEVAKAGLGMRPREATQALIQATNGLGGASVDTVLQEASSLMDEQWASVGLMPGAQRALLHLQESGIPLALASSTTAKALALKITNHTLLASKVNGGVFDTVITGESVSKGKPSPDIFLAAMKASGVTMDPKRVIVIEDSPAGVQAALAANMRVIAVPCPMPGGKKTDRSEYDGATSIISCLYDWRPDEVGLPAFKDLVGEVIPIDPWFAKGPVVKGFGRGSKSLGIPTANLAPSSWNAVEGGVPAQTSGIYAGWASRGNDPTVYPTALSVGWNPHFDSAEAGETESHSSNGKTLEPWLLHEFGFDFYGEELRLVVCGYIRPEAPFTTMEALIERIREDATQTNLALGMIGGSNDSHTTNNLRDHARHKFLKPEGWGEPTKKFLMRPTSILMSVIAIVSMLSIRNGPDGALLFPLGSVRDMGSHLFGGFYSFRFAVWSGFCLHMLQAAIVVKSALQSNLGIVNALKWGALTIFCGFSALSTVLLYGRSFIVKPLQSKASAPLSSPSSLTTEPQPPLVSSAVESEVTPQKTTAVKKRKKSGSKKKKQNVVSS